MNSMVVTKFGDVNSDPNKPQGLFGFAINDYLGERGIKLNDVADKQVMGFILDEQDDPEAISNFIGRMIGSLPLLEMIVIDFHLISKEAHDLIMETVNEKMISEYKYEELKNVYEDRYVYIRKQDNNG